MGLVFVSHRSADTAQATRLAEELRARGHQVWLDAWEVKVGDSIIQRMDEGLAETAYLVLCYSDAGLSAPWMNREWMSALARQLDGRAIAILPVRLTGGEPPAILFDYKYADLVTDWSKGIEELCKALPPGTPPR